ncbi:MAG: 5,10-methylenetetrahydromethanopterin reductase [Candidatus Helarchaeota archaeon]
MKFGIEFVPDSKIPKIVSLTQLAEENGFEYVWITDHYNNRNVYATLTAIALNTKTIKMGTGVTNAVLISPAWTAAAIQTINEISNGRAILGIGAGDKATFAKLGLGFEKPLTRIKEAVMAIQTLHQGKKLDFEGEIFNFKGAKLNFQTPKHTCGAMLKNKEVKAAKKAAKGKGEPMTCGACGKPITKDTIINKIPIYMGAQGPKMLALAGKLADGVLINASHPKDFEAAIKNIEEGAKSAGRSMDEIDVTAYASFSADPDTNAAKNAAAIVVAFITVGSPPIVLDRHGIKKEDVDKINDALAKGDFGAVANAVTPEMFEAFTIAGDADYCIERIKGLEKIGVNQVVVGSPIGPKKEDAIKYIAENIIKAF